MTADLFQFAQSRGYRFPEEPVTDGKIHRINLRPDGKGRSGWYIAFHHGDWMTVVMGDWADGMAPETWSSRPWKQLTQVQRAERQNAIEKAAKQTEQDLIKKRERAKRSLSYFWNNAVPAEDPDFLDHPYLRIKQIPSGHFRLYGKKDVDNEPVLLAPLRDKDGAIANIQRIYQDGKKRFIFGAPIKGLFFQTDRVQPSPNYRGEIVIAEGIATILTIKKFTTAYGYAAMTAGNLPEVTQMLREKFPDARLIIAADDDRWEKDGSPRAVEKNAGIQKAREAAAATRAIIVAPPFANVSSRGTDWNDLYLEEGEEAAVAKWKNAVTIAQLDVQLATYSDSQYTAQRTRLIQAYSAAGMKMGPRQIDNRRKESIAIHQNAVLGVNEDDEVSPFRVLFEICEDAELWKSQDGIAFASYPWDGMTVNSPVESQAFGDWLYNRWREETPELEDVLVPNTIKAFRDIIAAQARGNGVEHRTFHRIGYHAETRTYYLDLCRPDGLMVKFSREGRELVTETPLKFVRDSDMRPLPIPEPSPEFNGLDPLWEMTNVPQEYRVLIAGFLVGLLFCDRPSYGLSLFGPQGTSKSVSTQIYRGIIDPSGSPFQKLDDKNVDQLAVTVQAQWCPCFENVSSLSANCQDHLCSLITKLSQKVRKLYTNGETFSVTVRRPWIINGITNICTRPDLEERTIPVELSPIATRKSEDDIFSLYDRSRAHLLDHLINAAVHSLICQDVAKAFLKAERRTHRMQDALEKITGAEEYMGFEMGSFHDAIIESQNQSGRALLEDHPVVLTIKRLLDENAFHYIRVSISELLDYLHDFFPNSNREFPKAEHLTKWLARESERMKKALGINHRNPNDRQRIDGKRVRVREFWTGDHPDDRPKF